MRVDEVCEKYGLPKQVADVLERSGINELYPPQVTSQMTSCNKKCSAFSKSRKRPANSKSTGSSS